MSRFLTTLLDTAAASARGMTTGEPHTTSRRSWPEIHDAALRGAGTLSAAGVRRGSAVGVLAGEPGSIAPAVQAVWLVGGSVTMLHQPTARTDLVGWAEETVGVLKMIGAELVLLGAPFGGLASVLDGHGVPYRLLTDLDGGTPVEPDPDVAGEDDTALLQLTSGSTAEPKAVRITHRNLHANIGAMIQMARLDPQSDVMVSWLPLFHDMGMVGFLTIPMTVGIELVSVTPTDFLRRPLLWAELISRHRGTVTAAPNFAYAVVARQLARAEGPLDLSTLRFALNGAEPVDPDAVAAFTASGARFGLRPEAMVCAYGMAETALGVSFAPVDTGLQVDEIDAEQLEEHRRAVPATGGQVRRFPLLGPPLPGIEVRVVGDDGAVLGEREVGVLHLRGDSVTPGYLTVDGPVATQDVDGWLDTGDEGYLAGGAVVVCGRRKDVIIMGGRNIYPTDIERAASAAEGVRAGNAVAVRLEAGDDRRRESFLVAVESRLATEPDAADVHRRHARFILGALVSGRRAGVGMSQYRWISALASSIADLRAAITWALLEENDLALGIEVTAESMRSYYDAGLIDEYRRHVSKALDKLAPAGMADSRVELRLQLGLSFISGNTVDGDVDQARIFARIRELLPKVGSVEDRIESLFGMCVGNYGQGHYRQALACCDEIHELAQGELAPLSVAIADRMSVLVLHALGRHDEAERIANGVMAFNGARVGRRFLSEIPFGVSMRIRLARIHWLRGDFQRAWATAQEAMGQAVDAHVFARCQVLGLATIPMAIWSGDLAGAAQRVAELQGLAARSNLPYWQAYAQVHRCLVEGRAITARSPEGLLLDKSLPLADAASVLRSGAPGAATLARVRHGEVGWCAPEVLRQAALADHATQDLTLGTCLQRLQEALDLSIEQGARFWSLRILNSLCELAPTHAPLHQTAHQRLRSLLAAIDDGSPIPDLAQARLLAQRPALSVA